jgi:hypothetical protein
MYDKTYSDTFAPTVNFCTVLVIICLSAMFGWTMGSIDYSQAYLNANIDDFCVMRAPISVQYENIVLNVRNTFGYSKKLSMAIPRLADYGQIVFIRNCWN